MNAGGHIRPIPISRNTAVVGPSAKVDGDVEATLIDQAAFAGTHIAGDLRIEHAHFSATSSPQAMEGGGGDRPSPEGGPAPPLKFEELVRFARSREEMRDTVFGRELALKYLQAQTESTSSRKAMIVGASGAGKTYLVKRHLARLAKTGEYEIITLDAAGDLKTQVEEVIKTRGVEVKEKKESIRRLRARIWACINHFKRKKKRVVLFFDNYNASTQLIDEFFTEDILRRNKNIISIGTTCSESVAASFNSAGQASFKLSDWGEKDVVEYAEFLFADHLPEGLAQLIHKIFGGLPIFVDSIFHSLNKRSKAYIDDFYKALAEMEDELEEAYYRIDQQIALLADRIWLDKLSDDASKVLSVLTLLDPNHLNKSMLKVFFPDVEMSSVINRLLSQGLLTVGVEGEFNSEYRFHQKFQSILSKVIFSKVYRPESYPVVKGFSEHSIGVMRGFLENFSDKFKYDKYHHLMPGDQLVNFRALLAHAENIVASVVNIKFRHFRHDGFVDSEGNKLSHLKLRRTAEELREIKAKLGDEGIYYILKITSQLAAYYLYEQHSYWKAHEYVMHGTNLLASFSKRQSFECLSIQAKLLTIQAGIYDCRKKPGKSIARAKEAVGIYQKLEEEHPGMCQQSEYAIDRAVAYGTISRSYIGNYQPNTNDDSLKEASKCSNESIRLKQLVFGKNTRAIVLNLEKLAKIKMFEYMSAKKLGNHRLADKKYQSAKKILTDALGLKGGSKWDRLTLSVSLAGLYSLTKSYKQAIEVCAVQLAKMSLPEGPDYSEDGVKSARLPIDRRVIEALAKLAVIFYLNGDKERGRTHLARAVTDYMNYFEMTGPKTKLDKNEFDENGWIFKDFVNTVLSPFFNRKLYDVYLEGVDLFFERLPNNYPYLTRAFQQGLEFSKKAVVVVGDNTQRVGELLCSKLKAKYPEKEDGVVDVEDNRSDGNERHVIGVNINWGNAKKLMVKKEFPIPDEQKLAKLVEDLANGYAVDQIVYCGPDYASLFLSANADVIRPGLKCLSYFVRDRALLLCPTHARADFEMVREQFRRNLPKLDLCMVVHPPLYVPAKKKRKASSSSDHQGEASSAPGVYSRSHQLLNDVANFLLHVLSVDRDIESPHEKEDFVEQLNCCDGMTDYDRASLCLSEQELWDMDDIHGMHMLSQYGAKFARLSGCELPLPSVAEGEAPELIFPLQPSLFRESRAPKSRREPKRSVSYSGYTDCVNDSSKKMVSRCSSLMSGPL